MCLVLFVSVSVFVSCEGFSFVVVGTLVLFDGTMFLTTTNIELSRKAQVKK